MSIDLSTARVKRVRHELKRRDLQVVRINTISPHFRSITFAGDSLNDFVSASFDDHVKFILDSDGTDPVRRDYTPRHYDTKAGELTLEFALHDEGPASMWAAQAKPGQRATIAGPRGSFIIPVDYDWHVLIGDETALPAITRRLEELPVDAQVIAVLQVADAADQRDFVSSANAHVQWVKNTDEMINAVCKLELPSGEGYVWCAGEAGTMATLRKLLIEEKGHDRHAIRAAAYWKRGAMAHHENLET